MLELLQDIYLLDLSLGSTGLETAPTAFRRHPNTGDACRARNGRDSTDDRNTTDGRRNGPSSTGTAPPTSLVFLLLPRLSSRTLTGCWLAGFYRLSPDSWTSSYL